MKIAVYQTEKSVGRSNGPMRRQQDHKGVQKFLLADISIEEKEWLEELKMNGLIETITDYLLSLLEFDKATLEMN